MKDAPGARNKTATRQTKTETARKLKKVISPEAKRKRNRLI